jgi:hypothetical protein
MTEKRNKFKDIFFWAAWGTLLSIGVYIIALSLWPYDPLRIDDFSVSKKEVCRGEEICFRIVGEKFYSIPVRVSVELIDGENIAIINYVSNNPKGKGFPPRCFNIPYHIKPKIYHIRWTGVYEMNAFNQIRVVRISEPITILPSPKLLRGERGDTGKQGEKGMRGERGGISLFGEGSKENGRRE